jgi:nicotinate phosphoribosyltransferase
MNGLLTDLYELTMAAGYFEAGKTDEKATFELTFRRLPPNRNFILAAGLPRLVDYLLHLDLTDEEVEYLRGLSQFRHVSGGFWEYLRLFRFTGDLFAMPEGTPLFPNEPVAVIRAPIIEAQIAETYALAEIGFESMIATKAARFVEAAAGRPVVEF